MRVYHLLEEQGLVEVRERSGVYLAEQTVIGGGILAETGEWLVEDVLAKAWERRITFPRLPAFIERCTSSKWLRCAVLDSVRDQRETLAAEIRTDFGMDAVPVAIPPTAAQEMPPKLDLASLRDDLEGIDLLVTTTFHAPEFDLADQLNEPAVIVQYNPKLVNLIEERLAREPTTFVVLDPLFAERLRGQPVVVSRAARQLVSGLGMKNLLPDDVPVIAPDCARELAHWLVRLNLAGENSGNATAIAPGLRERSAAINPGTANRPRRQVG